MNDIREKVEELLYTRDKMMRSYWKTLREGFEGGYPMNWDEPFIALILRERQEATEQAVRVLRESLVGLSDGPNESWDSAIDSALSALDSAVKTLTNSSKPPMGGS